MFIVWATGHVTETMPDVPYTAMPYNINPLNKSAPGASATCCRASGQGLRQTPCQGQG